MKYFNILISVTTRTSRQKKNQRGGQILKSTKKTLDMMHTHRPATTAILSHTLGYLQKWTVQCSQIKSQQFQGMGYNAIKVKVDNENIAENPFFPATY